MPQWDHCSGRTIELRFRSGWFYLLLSFSFLCLSAPHVGCSNWRASQFYQSGSHALDEGDSTRAVSDLARAATLKPESSEIQNHLGIAYERAGEPAAALSAFERAVELDCDNAAASANLAALLEERRRGVKTSAAEP